MGGNHRFRMRIVSASVWPAAKLIPCLGQMGLGTIVFAAALSAGNSASSREIDFVQDVQPLLRKHCYQCHGPDVQEAGLRLDLKSHALDGGDNGRVIVAGAPDESPLMTLISSGDAEGRFMPPADEAPPLTPDQVALIRDWIAAGADWPDGVDGDSTPQLPLWSFQPVVRPPLPEIQQDDWVRNPVDTFILAGLEAAGMTPAPAASPRALARRASFDLLGLPPDPEDVDMLCDTLAASDSPTAFDRFVERLLSSPHYGERWGRHWLDLVRYADSNGYEVDGIKPMAWKYRDYVIRALNADTPYDRFIMEQLAGDELPDADSDTVIATGFYRVGPWDAERGASVQPSEVVAERFNELDDLVSTTSQVFLGLTLGCARCHDHKFDPLTTDDYYSLVAIFNPLTRQREGRTELTRPAVPPRDLQAKQQADARIAELKQRVQSLTEPLRRGLLESGQSNLPTDAVAAFATPPEDRTENQQQSVLRFTPSLEKVVAETLQKPSLASKYLSVEAQQDIGAAQDEIAELESDFDYPQGYFLFEPSPDAPTTHVLLRGNPNQPGAVVDPAVPAAVVEQGGRTPPPFRQPDGFTSQRRISLAQWISADDNPLTSRVLVNRAWQFHFGVGLVRTPSDFGRRGATPTHPELLDWLADWFVHDANWSLKELHRLIMTSNTYRMSKNRLDASAARDPDNLRFWRFPYRRLEVEAIRDAMLAVSGRLNRSLYGPSMFPHIPQEARQSGYDPKTVWQEFDERDASRRTIYAFLKRTLVVPFLDTLDFCDTTRSADRRAVTTVAPQALELLNGEFTNRQAKHFADRLLREAGDDVERQIEHAFRLALGRGATAPEQHALRSLWEQERNASRQQETLPEAEASQRALVQVCRVIFNLNEFVYPD